MKTQTVTIQKAMQGFTAEGIPQYMLQTPNAQMPTPVDAQTLPMYNEIANAPTSGGDVTHEGDVGAATYPKQ